MPPSSAGPYWVLAYDEDKGYALITGGQPNIETQNGLCRTGNGYNNSGIWIFLRSQERDEDLIQEVRDIALGQGIDVSFLMDVNQTSCDNMDKARYENDFLWGQIA